MAPALARSPKMEHAPEVTIRKNRESRKAKQTTDNVTPLNPPTNNAPSAHPLLAGGPDDNGNAEAMVHLFGNEFLFTPAYGWMHWTGTHWAAVPEERAWQAAVATLKARRHAAVDASNESIIRATTQSRNNVANCVALFRSYVIEPDVSVFDADPDSINCANGVLHIPTGKHTPHEPTQRFTYCLPVPWNPNADVEPWQRFILAALNNDPDTADYLQMCAGYSLTGHTREEKLFYVYGPPRAGKGTFTEAMLEIMPRPLGTEVDFASFTAKRDGDSQNFDLAGLKPARLVIASESNREQRLNSAKIKQLTGGNLVHCAFKHRDMFTYRPQFKAWLVSNWEVNADADDDAMWGRVQVFHFPNSHLGKEDTSLKANMKSPENLCGVLRWAVEGAMRWYKQGLHAPASVVNQTQAHRAKLDLVAQWIDDCCTRDQEAWASSASLTQSYQAWCENNGLKAQDGKAFAHALTTRFGCTPKRATGGTRGYKGITLGTSSLLKDGQSDGSGVTLASGVTAPEPASQAALPLLSGRGSDTSDTSNREIRDMREENGKTRNQVSLASLRHSHTNGTQHDSSTQEQREAVHAWAAANCWAPLTISHMKYGGSETDWTTFITGASHEDIERVYSRIIPAWYSAA